MRGQGGVGMLCVCEEAVGSCGDVVCAIVWVVMGVLSVVYVVYVCVCVGGWVCVEAVGEWRNVFVCLFEEALVECGNVACGCVCF